ncbi:MAG: phage tail protein [Lysinibacillus sp.]
MAEQTTNYNLTKPDLNDYYDRTIDNGNLDKIDRAIKEAKDAASDVDLSKIEQSIKDIKSEVTEHLDESASLTKKGHVQLSNATDSTIETLAATPKAVKLAMDRADAAFTSANNGKISIANVIGDPATTSDPFTQLSTHIQNAKNKGAINLTLKGQSANGTESLDSLMGKIANVDPGKKFASGKANTDINNVVTVHGLDFKPRIVHINYYNPSASVTTYHYMDNITRATTTKGTVIGVHMGITSNGSINGYGEIIERSDHLTSIFYDDGFAAYLNTTSTNVYWYAWE